MVRQGIIEKLAEKLQLPVEDVKDLINHNYTCTLEAIRERNIIEISGFGKFIFNKKKAQQTVDSIKEDSEFKRILQKHLDYDKDSR